MTKKLRKSHAGPCRTMQDELVCPLKRDQKPVPETSNQYQELSKTLVSLPLCLGARWRIYTNKLKKKEEEKNIYIYIYRYIYIYIYIHICVYCINRQRPNVVSLFAGYIHLMYITTYIYIYTYMYYYIE